MAQFGERLINGLKEAVAVAKGEAAPARPHRCGCREDSREAEAQPERVCRAVGRVDARRAGLGATPQGAVGGRAIAAEGREERAGGAAAGVEDVR